MDHTAPAMHLGPACREAILRHAEAAYPSECCGMLLGREENGARRITMVLPRDNNVTNLRERRFSIDPRFVLDAERRAAAEKLTVLGLYHSHPDRPAHPSEHDRAHAMPFWSYVIVAVQLRRAASLRSWRLRNDGSRFDEEAVT